MDRMSERIVRVGLPPESPLGALSRLEVEALVDTSANGVHERFRRCALAVLNAGARTDDTRAILAAHRDFEIRLVPKPAGLEIELHNPPADAFVDGEIIRGMAEHLFAVLRDIVYTRHAIYDSGRFDLARADHITSAVFHILRNAGLLDTRPGSRLAVCWGGHSIPREEYEHTKQVGYQLGLRGMDVCTGCGPGAMKGPMKGATIGHSKQRIRDGRYVGISEPGIIAAEAPNPIVNELAILPDMEKRLESFVRLAHGIVVFPGGVGTTEELLYLLAIVLDPANEEVQVPLYLTGPEGTEDYFQALQDFLDATLGSEARERFRIVVGDPEGLARSLRGAMNEALEARQAAEQARYFNWGLHIPPALQHPFIPTHESMAALRLSGSLSRTELAVALRRALTGIVAGNVKSVSVGEIDAAGPFRIHGDPPILAALERLLSRFIAEGRMTLDRQGYRPCYELVALPDAA